MSTTYKKNYLTEVIFRLDFSKNVVIGQLKDYSKIAQEHLPTKKQKEETVNLLGLNPANNRLSQLSEKRNAWTYSNKTGNKILEVGTNYIHLRYEKYKDFAELNNDISSLIIPFLEIYEIEGVSRIGLRYINNIIFNKENNPLDWGSYIQNNLIGGLLFSTKNTKKIARSMGQIIFKEDLGNIVFNYGVWNEDYPNQVLRKQFLLDYDCFSKLGARREDILTTAREYNKYIEELFEASIKKKLRDLLNKK